ncbi:hypothetical protein [Dongia sedimenti]|uniref:Uncharacterized protein n=1 Tax=Dongia sedimenti TaxID=3064282 RepID=A0ABU0YX07_9PROT|nr:hypothetical protein [Rhodospirillaceae bacterium R-7]
MAMIISEVDRQPDALEFDVTIVAVGYERRCRWIYEQCDIKAKSLVIGLEFGFLMEGSYATNRRYFEGKKAVQFINGLSPSSATDIGNLIDKTGAPKTPIKILVDISSMSRLMIANVVRGLQHAAYERTIDLAVAYAPSKFTGPYDVAPIRHAGPVAPWLAGWATRPDKPLGTIFGLGCEPNQALGALQTLEPDNAWAFYPKGIDRAFDKAMGDANQHLEDIFDVTRFDYEITRPSVARGRLEALLNSLEASFRLIVVPFGPKIFAWAAIATIVFSGRNNVGVWSFSSGDRAQPTDRDAEGAVIWHNLVIDPPEIALPELDEMSA